MADVMTTIGLSDQSVTAGLTRLESWVEAWKKRVSANPAVIGKTAIGGGGAGGGFDPAKFLSGQQTVRQPSAFETGLANAGSQVSKFASAASSMSSVATATFQVGMEMVRILANVERTSNAQKLWTSSINETVMGYQRAKSEIDKLADPLQRATRQEQRRMEGAQGDVMRSAQEEIKRLSDPDTIANVAGGALLSRVPFLNRFFDFDKRLAQTQIDDTVNTAQNAANRIAQISAQNQKDIRADAAKEATLKRQRELLEGLVRQYEQQRAVEELAAQSRAQNAELERQRQEDKVRKAQMLAEFENSGQFIEAQRLRLTGHEKEARLLEIKAEHQRRINELYQTQGLTQQQIWQREEQLQKLRDAEIAGLEKKPSLRRSGIDLSVGGPEAWAMQRNESTQVQELKKQTKTLEKIEKKIGNGDRW